MFNLTCGNFMIKRYNYISYTEVIKYKIIRREERYFTNLEF